jgi:hypothetical protein
VDCPIWFEPFEFEVDAAEAAQQQCPQQRQKLPCPKFAMRSRGMQDLSLQTEEVNNTEMGSMSDVLESGKESF